MYRGEYDVFNLTSRGRDEKHNAISSEKGNAKGHGVHILSCYLPVKSPWLNPIEPKWVHGKRAIVEPTRLLSAHEVADRVCAYVGCSHGPHLTIPDEVA